MKNAGNIGLLVLLALGLWFFSRKEKKLSTASEKVLEKAIVGHIKSLDPIHANDVISGNEVHKVYEGLVAYHPLKRPYELMPNLAKEMPTISADGLEYIFKIRKNVRFQDDPCFPNGKGRELTAADFVYSFKRLADVKLQAAVFSTIAGKIQGLDAWREKYATLSATDYKEEIAGLQALDKYTLQIKLVQPWPQMLYDLAYPWFSVVPEEAVQYYGQEFLNHPVGTGPFVLKEYNPQSNKLIYHKNLTFRAKYFPSEASEPYKHMLVDAGKPLPFVDKIISHIIVESQPQWLKFQKGALDLMTIPQDMLPNALTPTNELSAGLKTKKVQIQYEPDIALRYIAFNHLHPIFKNNLKLRQAISLAFNKQELNQLVFNNRAVLARSILPPGVEGYRANDRSSRDIYDLNKAKKLLIEAGYPGGKSLPEITLDIANNPLSKRIGEHFQRSLTKIGVCVKVVANPWPQLLKKITNKTTMLHIMGLTNYSEGLAFVSLLYGPVAPGRNTANFDDTKYNALYEQSVGLPDASKRTRLYQQMNQLAAEKVALIYLDYPVKYTLYHSWLKNYTLPLSFVMDTDQYLDIDMKQKKSLKATF